MDKNLNYRKRPIWFFKGSVAQVVGVPAAIGATITIPNGAYAELLACNIHTGTVGAPRTCELDHKDKESGFLRVLMKASLDSNKTIFGPLVSNHVSTAVADTPSAIGANIIPYPLGAEELLVVNGTSLANTEVMSFEIRMFIYGIIPTIVFKGAGITLTTTKNKVI